MNQFKCVMCKKTFYGEPARKNACGTFCRECSDTIANKVSETNLIKKKGIGAKMKTDRLEFNKNLYDNLKSKGWVSVKDAAEIVGVTTGGSFIDQLKRFGIPSVLFPCGGNRTRTLFLKESVLAYCDYRSSLFSVDKNNNQKEVEKQIVSEKSESDARLDRVERMLNKLTSALGV